MLAGVVVAAICQSLQSNQRFYRSQSQLLDVEEGLRAVAQLVPATGYMADFKIEPRAHAPRRPPLSLL